MANEYGVNEAFFAGRLKDPNDPSKIKFLETTADIRAITLFQLEILCDMPKTESVRFEHLGFNKEGKPVFGMTNGTMRNGAYVGKSQSRVIALDDEAISKIRAAQFPKMREEVRWLTDAALESLYEAINEADDRNERGENRPSFSLCAQHNNKPHATTQVLVAPPKQSARGPFGRPGNS